MASNIVIPDPSRLEKLKKAISRDGTENIHVISDFDRTLTYAFVNGEKVPSLISILRDGSYLSEEYAKKAHALFKKYHAIEIDPNVSASERKKAMLKWWSEHFDLLLREGLNKRDLERVVQSENIRLREGVLDFIDLLHAKSIPLVILSSTGLGGEAISLILQRYGKEYDNVYIVSNSFVWDKEGKATGVKKPIIHSMNKDEAEIKKLPVYQAIKNRRNVLLLGDSLGDVDMAKGLEHEQVIKIGFLNEDVEKSLKKYKEVYDVVLLGDGDVSYVNSLIREMFG